MTKIANKIQTVFRSFGASVPKKNDDPRPALDDESAPLAKREQGGREFWEGTAQCIDVKTDADRRTAAIQWGGHGFLAWCLAGCPEGRMDDYLKGAAR